MTGFLFDLNACTGCRACELACAIENDLPWDRSWRRVSTFNPQRASGAPVFHLSLACNHCSAAPCIEQCPALAIRRDADGGAVLIETVFAWPGIGRLLFDALAQRDYSLLLGTFLVTAALAVLFNVITDVVYTVVDPRIELS